MRQLAWLICDLGYVTEVRGTAGGMELVNVPPQAARNHRLLGTPRGPRCLRTVGGLSASATRREGDPRRGLG